MLAAVPPEAVGVRIASWSTPDLNDENRFELATFVTNMRGSVTRECLGVLKTMPTTHLPPAEPEMPALAVLAALRWVALLFLCSRRERARRFLALVLPSQTRRKDASTGETAQATHGERSAKASTTLLG